MAKNPKNRKAPASKGRASSAPAPPPDLPPFDRRLMDRTMLQIQKVLSEHEFTSIDEANAFMREMMTQDGLPEPQPRTPQEEAQELMFEAFEADGRRRADLARKALSIDPDCADAYVLLAEETAKSPREALQLYCKGVQAGERSLGPEVFKEAAGHFWSMVETRPYMRAMAGQAEAFLLVGQRDDAISTWHRMIELNPGDNQGVRDFLVSSLLGEKRTEEVGKLLEQYGDSGGASWDFSTALWLFQKEGVSPAAERALRAAIKANKYVAPYLAGLKMPGPMPHSYSFGGPDEALIYTHESLLAWYATTGAIRWLCRVLGIDDSTG